MASLFLVALDQTIVSTALSKIVEQFNAFDSLSWIVTAYLITTTITVPIAGKMSDLFGRKIMLLIGVAIFTAGSLLSGTSGTMNALIFHRAIQGIGGGIITANAFTIVGDLFAARERGKWQGLIGAVFGVSSVVGPLLGGWLTDGAKIMGVTTDWHWIFYINIPIGIVAFLLVLIFCPALRHDKKPKVDCIGAVLIAAILGLLVLAVDNTDTIFSGLMKQVGLNLVALRAIMFGLIAVLIAAFAFVENKVKEPILPLSLFKNRDFVIIIIVAALFGGAFMGSVLYLVQFNQQVFGATATGSGLMLLPMMAGDMISSIGVGQLITKTGKYKRFIILGLSLTTIGLFSLMTLNQNSPYMQEAIIMLIVGFGMGSVLPVLSLAMQSEFRIDELGVATSSSQLFRSLGSTIGTALFGAVLTAGMVSNVSVIKNTDYIRSLEKIPQAKQIGDFNDSNTLLNLNMPDVKEEITQKFSDSTNKLPENYKKIAKDKFITSQNKFSIKVKSAFVSSLRRIFLTAGFMALFATIIIIGLREKTLRKASETYTPGEEN
jgi:EmrB/QacA subfamily drug resistance transporter